jgi:serine/threonine protein phosphatase 1
MFLSKLFKKKSKQGTLYYVPEDTCVYAVGDIHGRLDLLKEMNQKIIDDMKKNPCARKVVVYLGDYIDRGRESKGVISELISNPIAGAEIIHLRGNHEQTMIDYFGDKELAASWFLWGGAATVRDYGVGEWDKHGRRLNLTEVHEQFVNAVPDDHKEFIRALPYTHEEGDYVFVHAGFRPHLPMDEQNSHDMMTIRDTFIKSAYDFGKMVVFGHTVQEEVFKAPGRLGIDTGAYATGVLTAVVLCGSEQRFLQTSPSN